MSHTTARKRHTPFTMTSAVFATVVLGVTVGCQATPGDGTGFEAQPDPTPPLEEGPAHKGALALSFAPTDGNAPLPERPGYTYYILGCEPLEITCPAYNGFYPDHRATAQCSWYLLDDVFPGADVRGLLEDHAYFCRNVGGFCTPERASACDAVKEILTRHYLSEPAWQSALHECCKDVWWDGLTEDQRAEIKARTF